ncbi:MAG TPA: TolC family protein [Gemmatimonadaceae bacterium]|nr:TolC family protein [Gemmatimonadaceae bacterium]
MTTSGRNTGRAGRLARPLLAAAILITGGAALAPAAAQNPGAPLPGDSARPITIDEAVRLAQRNAPAAVQARGQERTGRSALRSAYGAFIPNLNFNASSSWQQGTTLVAGNIVQLNRDAWNFTNGLSASLDLFNGRRLADIRQARADVEAASANELSQRFGVALNVKQQYFAVLAARESEAAARAQLAQAEQQLKSATARVGAGVATKSDSLRSVIQVGNAQLALVTAQNALRVANASLTRLVATPFLVTASPSDTLERAPVAADSATLARLAAQGPMVAQAEANVVSARAARSAARAPYLPTLSVQGSYSGNLAGSNFNFGDAAVFANGTYPSQKSVRFTLSYPLFNQFNREEQVVRADVARENAEAQLRDARLAAQQSLVQYLGALRTAEQRVAIQQASVAAAEEDLRVQQQRYSLGASTLLDLLTSQTQLDQARAALIQARYDYRVAKAQLEALVGQAL